MGGVLGWWVGGVSSRDGAARREPGSRALRRTNGNSDHNCHYTTCTHYTRLEAAREGVNAEARCGHHASLQETRVRIHSSVVYGVLGI